MATTSHWRRVMFLDGIMMAMSSQSGEQVHSEGIGLSECT
jgi:hypothetical protein